MRKSRKIPLACGLVGGKTDSIQGQLEVYLNDYKTIDIVFKRKAYSKHRDVKFSTPDVDLQDIIDILHDAKKKLDEQWLSTVASTRLTRKVHV